MNRTRKLKTQLQNRKGRLTMTGEFPKQRYHLGELAEW